MKVNAPKGLVCLGRGFLTSLRSFSEAALSVFVLQTAGISGVRGAEARLSKRRPR